MSGLQVIMARVLIIGLLACNDEPLVAVGIKRRMADADSENPSLGKLILFVGSSSSSSSAVGGPNDVSGLRGGVRQRMNLRAAADDVVAGPGPPRPLYDNLKRDWAKV